jgi:hypothetical protein
MSEDDAKILKTALEAVSKEYKQQDPPPTLLIDRVLDLALAFEIALSDQGDNAPPSWKVSVRSVQLVGGHVAVRSQNRQAIAELYELRNQATHGGSLKPRGGKAVEAILQDGFALYVAAIGKLLDLRTKPDWKTVELEPLG